MTIDYPLQRLVYTAPPRRRLGSGLLLGLSDAYTKGGASIWQTPPFDPELGVIYFGTGNAHPDSPELTLQSASHSLVEVTVVSTSWNRQ
jgi:glucose dehydrogenase